MDQSLRDLIDETVETANDSVRLYLRVRALINPDLTEETLAGLKQAADAAWPPLVVLTRRLRVAGPAIERGVPAIKDPRSTLELLRALADSWLLITISDSPVDLLSQPLASEDEINALGRSKRIKLFFQAAGG